MGATVNTAALFFRQYKEVPLTEVGEGQPATIVGVYDGGFRVDVVVRKAGALKETPDGIFRERAVPYIADGATPPTTGFFVTSVDFTFPAPPTPPVQDSGSGGSGSGSGGSGSGGSSTPSV